MKPHIKWSVVVRKWVCYVRGLRTTAATTRKANVPQKNPEYRYFADGPKGEYFFTGNLDFARRLVELYDKDDDWTITDLWNPTGEESDVPPRRET